MRRWRERMAADRRKSEASGRRIPQATMEEVLRLYRETYFDLKMRHFQEKLRDVSPTPASPLIPRPAFQKTA